MIRPFPQLPALKYTRGQTSVSFAGQLKLPVRARDRTGGRRVRKTMKTTRIKTTVDPTKVSTVCEVGSSRWERDGF